MNDMSVSAGSNGTLRQPSGERQLGVLILHQQQIIREGLKTILDQTGQFGRTDTCGTAVEAVAKMTQGNYRLVLVECCAKGMRMVRLARHADLSTPILFVSSEPPEYEVLSTAFALEVRGCVNLVDAEDLLRGVERVWRGQEYLSPAWGVEFLRSGPGPRPCLQLSTRERQVLASLRGGASFLEIAEDLELSVSTVRCHTIRLYRKLGVCSRDQACRVARELGLLPGS